MSLRVGGNIVAVSGEAIQPGRPTHWIASPRSKRRGSRWWAHAVHERGHTRVSVLSLATRHCEGGARSNLDGVGSAPEGDP
ncbi:MAG: hypothetical protein LBT00_08205 [Spirochaetaceae bacterium]|nr:hypothetical protein [Spirochaetaceae bacterium]